MLKEKLIVIADHDEQSVNNIKAMLNASGFKRFVSVADDSSLLTILGSIQHSQGEFGLVIINENIPGFDFQRICVPLSKGEHGTYIPFIVLSNQHKELQKRYPDYDSHLIYFLQKNFHPTELILLIELLQSLKNECQSRFKQEQLLLVELSERKIIDAKLNYLIAHDELTGFLNRGTFESKMRDFLDFDYQGGLLFLDIDRFCLINEIEGFTAGDLLIVEISGLIRRVISSNCLFSRIGADEFCLFLENKTVDQIQSAAEEIRSAVEKFHFMTGNVCYNISISIGVLPLYPGNVFLHPGDMIARAHQACQMAKTNGRNMAWTYTKDEKTIMDRHRDVYWAPQIKDALLNNRFFLEFQPIVSLTDGIVSHYETLIRIADKTGSKISPVEFIPVAERMGMIHNIDKYVVEHAILFLADLPDDYSHISLSVNLSSVAFQDAALLSAIEQMFQTTGVLATRLIFEITETVAVENFQHTRIMIEKIRELGCSFALDDFGAGFCSFSYLKKFPAEYIKIDGQFIRNIVEDETDQVLVRSMCEIAKKLGKKTIAEFVESPEVISLLREIGIDYGQGHIFGKPKAKLLESHSIAIDDLLVM